MTPADGSHKRGCNLAAAPGCTAISVLFSISANQVINVHGRRDGIVGMIIAVFDFRL